MNRDLSKLKTAELLNEASSFLEEASKRLDLEHRDRELIVDHLDQIDGMIRDIEETEDELEESLLEQDRQDGLRLRSQNLMPQEGR